MNEDIHAFRASSDRARYVIFIIHAVTLLMLIAAWNYHRWSWSSKAADKYYENRKTEQAVRIRPAPASGRRATESRRDPSASRVGAARPRRRHRPAPGRARAERAQRADFEQVLAMRLPSRQWPDREHDVEWYGGQTAEFYGRGIFVPVPGLGASLHINDMALVGGMVLLALTALLWIMLIRQHENLYLALYKIGRIRAAEGKDARDGDSVSNLMYHALAMAQVLSHPPTLARWNLRLRHYVVHRIGAIIVYFTPALVHGGIVVQNILSRKHAVAVWGEWVPLRLTVQAVFSVSISPAAPSRSSTPRRARRAGAKRSS